MSKLELRNISKRFGKAGWGVKAISLEVNDEEFVVLLGPSGCGKTTTLRVIAGLEDATSGSVLLNGRDITAPPSRKRNVSMVFQNYAVWPHMTVFENIAFPLRMRKMARKDIDRSVKDVAQLTRIHEYLERYPGQLSGGQQQRVALARALAVKPELFLMDEPFSNLDALLRMAMRTELKTIHQLARATTIFVTHDQSEAMSMADRIVIIKDGEIAQIDSPDDVYFRPANAFVAGFIGTPPMNFFDVGVERSDKTVTLRHPSFEKSVSARDIPELARCQARRLILGVRPESITLTNPEQAVFSQRVLVVEPQGATRILAVELDNRIVKITLPAETSIHPGELAHLGFDARNMHLFDPDSGLRLD